MVRPRGAYGLRLTGLDTAAKHLVDVPSSWPEMTIERVAQGPAMDPSVLDDHRALYRTPDDRDNVGSVRIERNPLTAIFSSLGEFDDESVIHPHLSLIAAVHSYWCNRDAFHAGAFLTDAGAWAILGAREAGKSSLLGHLATTGMGVLTDDVLIMQDDQVCAGPRCVDLREGAARWFGQGEVVGASGPRPRWRMLVAPVPPTVPLRGWILPEWGDAIHIELITPARRLPVLYANLVSARLPRDPEGLLDLATLPLLSFRRPRRWAEMDRAAWALLEAVRC